MEIASDGVCRLNIMYPDTGFLIPFSYKPGHYLRLERSVFSGTSFIPTLSGSFCSISVHLHLQAERSASVPVVDFSTCPLSFFCKSTEKGESQDKNQKKTQTLSWGRIKDGPDLLERKVGRVGRTPCVLCHCLGVFVLPDSRGE